MFQWLFGDSQKRAMARQSDRTERNAVIRRIVSAAASTTPKAEPPRPADTPGEVIGPFTVTADLSPTESGGLPRDRIAERAYEIWIANGRPTGTADRDWQQAVREIAAEQASPAQP